MESVESASRDSWLFMKDKHNNYAGRKKTRQVMMRRKTTTKEKLQMITHL